MEEKNDPKKEETLKKKDPERLANQLKQNLLRRKIKIKQDS